MTYLEQEEIIQKGEEFRKAVNAHPELPVVFLGGLNSTDGEHLTTFCTFADIKIGEVLDKELPADDVFEGRIYTDRKEFHEDMYEYLSDEWEYNGYDWSTEHQERYAKDPDKAIKEDIAEYDKYWRKCIMVTVDN